MTLPPSDPTRSASPAAVPVMLLIVFVSLIGFGMVIPLLPFLGTLYKAPAWQVTLIFSAYSAGQFLGELYWGRLSDRIGRRPVLLVTILGAGVGYIALAFSPTIWLAVLARFAGGFFSGNLSTMQGYIVDVSPPERVPGRLAMVSAAFSVGFVVGPAIGGLMARPDLGPAGFRPPLELAASLCVVAALGAVFFLRESLDRRHDGGRRPGVLAGVSRSFEDPMLRVLMAGAFTIYLAFTCCWAVLGLWGEARFGWGPPEIGLLLATSGVCSALCQGLLAGRVVRWLGGGRTIACGVMVTGLALVLQAYAPWSWAAIVCMCVAMSSHSVVVPAITTLVAYASPPAHQGANLGANNAAGSFSRIIGPAVGGLMFTMGGAEAPFLFAGVGMVPAVYFGLRAARLYRERQTS